jgi:thymidylate kinase
MNIPRPDCNIILQVPAEVGQLNVDAKEQRSYTTKKRDIHEEDIEFLRRSVAVYTELCQLFPKNYIPIRCVDEAGRMKPFAVIHEAIWHELTRRITTG